MDKKSRGASMISYEPLRKLLKSRHISTYYLRNKCGRFNLDSKTIQRLMNDESISTYTLNALCNILNCTPADLMEFTPDQEQENKTTPEA